MSPRPPTCSRSCHDISKRPSPLTAARRIERDRDLSRKADLAAMGMTAQQDIEVGIGSLPRHRLTNYFIKRTAFSSASLIGMTMGRRRRPQPRIRPTPASPGDWVQRDTRPERG